MSEYARGNARHVAMAPSVGSIVLWRFSVSRWRKSAIPRGKPRNQSLTFGKVPETVDLFATESLARAHGRGTFEHRREQG